jgi:hypothetical protein
MRPLGHFGGLLLGVLEVSKIRLKKGAGSGHESSERREMTWVWSLFGKSDLCTVDSRDRLPSSCERQGRVKWRSKRD